VKAPAAAAGIFWELPLGLALERRTDLSISNNNKHSEEISTPVQYQQFSAVSAASSA
jgi:hypothetical protein